MKTVHIALVVDANGSPLTPERQLAVALTKALSRKVKVTSATLIGWPVQLVRMEELGGYLSFDETGQIDTKFDRVVLGDYEHYLNSFSKLTTPDEFLNVLRNVPWFEPRGVETVRLKGLISEDITPFVKNPSVPLPTILLERKITDDVISLEIEEWRRIQKIITGELEKLEEYKRSFSAISEMFIGKLAEERRKTESLYDQQIERINDEMEQLLKVKKPLAYEEVKKKSLEFSSKIAEIYGVMAKTRLDVESGKVSERQAATLESAKEKILKDLDNQLNKLLEPYLSEIRVLKQKIDSLEKEKKEELMKIDSKLELLRKTGNDVIASFERVKENKKRELNQITSLARRTIYIEDRVEAIVPVLLVRDALSTSLAISGLIYSGKNKSFLNLGSIGGKLNNISTPINDSLTNLFKVTDPALPDNIKLLRREIENGVLWLEEEGWKVRKLFEDYFW
ncbi:MULTISPECIES: hypothetical protein [Metallosphaera]|uniref:Uncharacterized protein n=1 Tax=Metallosphaera cuprina (strain Ar-4) TaxID=1006006 RepID=F4FYN0_METCR|nr:hypothetical protein [Metallosphaera cuprina]AEB95528.1 conserved hypothetical protein [Metallosphaera cuprina Ar-4]